MLITGENGTGKELVARAIHRLSARADSPLVEVNCAAIPEELIESELFGHVRGSFTGAAEDRRGKFEEADGATLFLDEIGDMSARTQAKVLRALQEGRFTRVGGHEGDLLRRARPLGDQQEPGRRDPARDVPRGPLLPPRRRARSHVAAAAGARARTSRALARHFLEQASAPVRPAAQAALRPALGGALLLPLAGQRPGAEEPDRAPDDPLAPPTEIRPRTCPPSPGASTDALPPDAPLRDARDDFERRYILATLRRYRGNVTRAAEALEIERSNLYRKLKAYGIEVERG